MSTEILNWAKGVEESQKDSFRSVDMTSTVLAVMGFVASLSVALVTGLLVAKLSCVAFLSSLLCSYTASYVSNNRDNETVSIIEELGPEAAAENELTDMRIVKLNKHALAWHKSMHYSLWLGCLVMSVAVLVA